MNEKNLNMKVITAIMAVKFQEKLTNFKNSGVEIVATQSSVALAVGPNALHTLYMAVVYYRNILKANAGTDVKPSGLPVIGKQ